MTAAAIFLAIFPLAASAAPWDACAQRAADAVRAARPEGARLSVAPLTDAGGRLGYLGAAIAEAVAASLRAGSTSFAVLAPEVSAADGALSGEVVDRDARIEAVLSLTAGGNPPREAARCSWDKDAAFAEALRGELERRRAAAAAARDAAGIEVRKFDDILLRGVWKEGPRFAAGEATAAAKAETAAPAAPKDGAPSFMVGGGVQARRGSTSWEAAVRARVKDGRWDAGLEFGHFSATGYQFETPQGGGNGLTGTIRDQRRLDVYHVRPDVRRRWKLLRWGAPGSVREMSASFGGGLGLYFLSEGHVERRDLRSAVGLAVIPPVVAGERAVRLKPHFAAALALALAPSLEAEFGADVILFSKKIGPAFIPWGGPAARASLMYRFY